jgi:hypothetical protein
MITRSVSIKELRRRPLRQSKAVEAIFEAARKGYRVTEDGAVVAPSGRVLKPWVPKRGSRIGYGKFSLDRNTKIEVHQFAAFQWYGDVVLRQGVEVRHLDGDPTNNARNNIDFGTPTDNEMDKDPQVRRRVALQAARKRRKLGEVEVAELRADREKGATYSELQAKYGISKCAVSYIVNRKTYR